MKKILITILSLSILVSGCFSLGQNLNSAETKTNIDLTFQIYTEVAFLDTETPTSTSKLTATRTPNATVTLTPTATAPAISMNARVIYYSSTTHEIRLLDLQSGTDSVVYTESDFHLSDPHFLLDGEQFVFLSDQWTTTMNLYLGNIDGSEPRQLTKFPGRFKGIAVSPDGDRIVFIQDVFTNDRHNLDIFSLDIRSGSIDQLTFDGQWKSAVTWSHDGTHIAYTEGGVTGNGDLVVISSDGSGRRVLVNSIISLNNLISWSGDNSQIVVPAKREENVVELLVSDVETQDYYFLTDLGWKCFKPDWSIETDIVIFKCNNNSVRNIFIIDIQGQSISQLTDYPLPEIQNPRGLNAYWAPDGKHIFLISQEDRETRYYDLFLIDENGMFHQLTDRQRVDYFDVWMPNDE